MNAIHTIDASDLVKKLNTTEKLIKLKRNTYHNYYKRYITTQEFNKLTSERFAARLKKPILESKNFIAYFVKKQILMITKIVNKKLH